MVYKADITHETMDCQDLIILVGMIIFAAFFFTENRLKWVWLIVEYPIYNYFFLYILPASKKSISSD